MSQKVRKTLIMIVMAALIICLMAASLTYTFTYGRYTGKDFDAEKSPYDDLIEFVGANQYLVYSPEELIQAIKDGYSNIQIADEAEQPFVITEGVTDVTANLVLDVNGKTLIRNSRNPMLDVQTNVSVVLVYDSSDDKQGGFYNPVGSALQASGGTLTVGSGNYDDGPKGTYSTSDISQSTSATLVTRTDRTETSYGTPTKGVADLPKIDKNHYFSEDASTGSFNTTYIKPDTFLILTYEDDCREENGNLITGVQTSEDGTTTTAEGKALTVPCNAASCDFYYYYEVGDNPTTTEKETDTYAVVYGYNDVKALARDDLPEGQTEGVGMATALKEKGLIWPYAAVRMEEGEGFARGGTFSNHFDAVNTYGIYAEGGTLTASGANFTTGGNGVCIRVQSATGEATITGETTTTGGSLTISGGSFSSEIGNTIEMSGGNMTVTKGTFTKDATGADPDSTDNGSAIDIQGGTLSMTGSDAKTFTITGSHVNGIKSSGGGTVTAEHTTFSMSGGTDVVPENGNNYGTDMFGINIDSGTVTANGCDITIYGTYSAGILSMGKNVDGSTVSVGAADNTASEIKVYVPESQKLLSSAGISSEGGKIQLTGNVNIETNGLGITARGPIDIIGGEAKVTTTHGTGIYVSGATITNTATLKVKSNITSGWSWVKRPENSDEDVNTNVNNGIYVENGSIDASAGTLNVTHTGVAGDAPDNNSTTGAATKSYAVFVKGDAESGSQNTTVSIGAGTITGTKAGGVYVVGTKQGEDYTATVTLGGVTINAEDTYAAGILTETGNVIINGNALITSSALGIAVINGNMGIGLDNQTVNASVKATRATGVYVRGGTLYNLGTLSVTSTIGTEENSYLAANAYQYAGADISTSSTNPNPYNGVYVYGGSLTSEGTLNVTFTGVESDAPGTGENNSNLNGFNAYRLFQIKSYAVRVEGSGATTVMITSGTITNEIGGGVLVNGGTVELGTANDTTGYSANNPTGLTVQTTGTELYYDANSDWISNQLYDAYSDRSNQSNSKSWKYLLSSEGGPAIKIVGGTLKVNGGKYTAQQGDGIVTNGGSSYIYNGVFIGKDSYTILDNDDGISFLKIEGNVTTTSPLAGPAASYAFKVYSGTATVYGGTFGDPSSIASGAFVMGTEDSPGTANIFGGTFDVSDSGDNGGQAGFSAYVYTNVTFTEDGSDENGTGGKITVQGLAAGLTLESAGEGSNNPYQGGSAQVIINSGSFSSMKNNNNSDGIWYGNGSTTLNISGGTFTGAARSGLYFEVAPTSGGVDHVTLSGGTYHGSHGAINAESPESISTGNIIASNAYCFNSVVTGQGEENKPYAICKGNYRFFWYEYTHVGGNGGNESVNLDERTYINGLNGTDFNGRGTIYISDQNGKVENYTGPLI